MDALEVGPDKRRGPPPEVSRGNGPWKGAATLRADTDGNGTGPGSAVSTPRPSRPIEVSRGILEPKHFAKCLGGPALLYLKFISETAFGETRWRNGAWVSSVILAAELGVLARTLRRWLRALEADEYIRVQRHVRRGCRITLRHRIWYFQGKAVKAVPRPDKYVQQPDKYVQQPDTFVRLTPTEAASGAGFVLPSSVDSPSVDSPSKRNPLNQEAKTPGVPTPRQVLASVAGVFSPSAPNVKTKRHP
jgi:hypothetical protein